MDLAISLALIGSSGNRTFMAERHAGVESHILRQNRSGRVIVPKIAAWLEAVAAIIAGIIVAAAKAAGMVAARSAGVNPEAECLVAAADAVGVNAATCKIALNGVGAIAAQVVTRVAT